MKISYERDRMYDNKTDKSNRFQIKALDRKSKSQAFFMSCNSYKCRNLFYGNKKLFWKGYQFLYYCNGD